MGEENEALVPDDIIEVETWPKIIPLKHPVMLKSGQRVTELEFRRGALGDIKGIKLGQALPTDDVITLVSRLTGQALSVIERLDPEDAGPATDIAMRFFAKCLGTGKKE